LIFFLLVWFVLIQAEYEVITKPELRDEIPLVPGIWGVYFLGFIVLILSLIILYLFYILIKKFKNSNKNPQK